MKTCSEEMYEYTISRPYPIIRGSYDNVEYHDDNNHLVSASV
jgi:hypothetical protein